jgi:uncharacterized membrane protein
MNDETGKVLRTVGIIFFGLTTAMNLLGGIGTTCAAFLTRDYPPYWALIKEDLQWLYQGLVVTTVILGIVGIWVTVQLARGKKTAFRNALIVLVIGTILGGIQFYYSMQLFGKAIPANVKFFSNVVTLILFLIFLIPSIRERVNFSKNNGGTDKNTAGGLAAIMVGMLLLTTPIWAGSSHTFQGENWVNLLQTPLYISGILLTGGGIALLMRVAIDIIRQEYAMADIKLPKDS